MGLEQRNRAALAAFVLYVMSLGMWIVAPKPIQFYYHYMLPACFLIACLTLVLDDLWQRGGMARRAVALGVVAASCGMFAWFYPIISAAPLDGPRAFEHWMWLKSWR